MVPAHVDGRSHAPESQLGEEGTGTVEEYKKEIAALIAQAQKSKCQIVEAELQSCRFAITFSYLELQLRSFDTAKRWVKDAEKHTQAIQTLLTEIADEERRCQFHADLELLQAGTAALKKRLPSGSSAG
jgi:hypothetical protein